MPNWLESEGSPRTLGATWLAGGTALNFALYSRFASRVTLLLYSATEFETPVATIPFDPRSHKSGRVWHMSLPQTALQNAAYYAYQVDGPNSTNHPAYWHGFDPDKVLLDPYAELIFFPPAFDRLAAIGRGSNAGKAALGVLPRPDTSFDWSGDRVPRHDHDLIIYELHVRGFTRSPSSGVSPESRGTFAGLNEKIPYLKELGITAVELMPVYQFDPQDGNFWGYMPMGVFALHRQYSRADAEKWGQAPRPDTSTGGESTGTRSQSPFFDPRDEFRALVKALHAAGIEVYLDVVYNHTAEGGVSGPTFNYKGIDTDAYYILRDNPGNPYQDFTGCGNTLDMNHGIVRRLARESLRYWATEMHVDGFRFDLAATASRADDGSIRREDPAVFEDVGGDPVLSNLRGIVEPWDASGGYQLGTQFPGRFGRQWNARFRDEVRRFVRGDGGLVAALMYRLYGSDDLFPDGPGDSYHPYQSVNYLCSHDGFTLYDLCSYQHKRNAANGHDNTDGPHEEFGWNCGHEGDEDVPVDVAALRRRQIKNLFAILMLSNGTPMLRAGDEFLQTQGGNNNPYNQDNETSWLNWDRLRENADMFRFFRLVIAFRKAHPSIARSRFWREDVKWFGTQGPPDLGPNSHTLAYFLSGKSQNDADLYVMINAYTADLEFIIQEGKPGDWKRVLDTSLAAPHDIFEPNHELPVLAERYLVQARSLAVLIRG